jgi:hypothetical protein
MVTVELDDVVRSDVLSRLEGIPSMFAWMKDLPVAPDDPVADFRRFYYDTSVQDVPLALYLSEEEKVAILDVHAEQLLVRHGSQLVST